MKKYLLLFGLLSLFVPLILAEEKEDPRSDKAIAAAMSNPHVIAFANYMIENNGIPMFYIENDKEEQKKGKFDIYVGEDHEDHTVRNGAYSFDFNTKTLSYMDLAEGGDYKPTEYNKLLFADIKVDSTYPGYSIKPMTDCMFTKKGGRQAKKRAWASAENDQEHWIKASFDAPVTLQKVMLFWAWDKGTYYHSKDIHLSYLDASGHKVEIKDLRKTDDVVEKDWKLKDSDLQQTQWTFPAVVTKQLILKQGPGGGDPKRPNLIWVSQVWAY